MISSIGLKNIRVFKNWTEFDLSPITILTGTNDSGKSALQKALILLSNGFERIQGGMCNFEKIQFSKEFLELTGDFVSNLNYGSKNQNLEFSFNFEDELFGPVKAEISYEKGIDILTAIAKRIVFKQNGIEFLCFNRFNVEDHLNNESIRTSVLATNKDTSKKDNVFSEGKYAWKLSPDNEKLFLPFIRNLILQAREDGRSIKKLQSIEDKFKDKGKLNDEEKELWERMKDLKISFKIRRINSNSDTIPVDLKNKRDKDRLFRLWKFQKLLSEIFLKFNSPFTEILFDTPLVELVLGKEKILTGTKNLKLLPIYNALLKNGISSKDDFLNAYKEFELQLIKSIFEWYKKGYKIHEYSEKRYIHTISFFGELELSDNLTKKEILNKKFVKSSIIAKILDDNYPFLWYDKDGEPIKEFEDQILFIRESLFGLTKTLGKELNKLNESIKFSLQNSTIRRHLFFSDKTINDLPSLDFGLKYINDSKEMKDSRDFINIWIKEFEIADEFIVKPITIDEEIIGVSYYLKKGGKMHSLGDSGRGINQLFFIIIKIATLDKKSILMLEEPETNMHPALQSKLADMLIMAKNKFKVSFIIETHSEYLIRKLQYLVASDKSEVKPEDISLCYFYKPNHPDVLSGKAYQVEKIMFDKYGRLSKEFGSGFFDEADNIATELFLLSHPQSN